MKKACFIGHRDSTGIEKEVSLAMKELMKGDYKIYERRNGDV